MLSCNSLCKFFHMCQGGSGSSKYLYAFGWTGSDAFYIERSRVLANYCNQACFCNPMIQSAICVSFYSESIGLAMIHLNLLNWGTSITKATLLTIAHNLFFTLINEHINWWCFLRICAKICTTINFTIHSWRT